MKSKRNLASKQKINKQTIKAKASKTTDYPRFKNEKMSKEVYERLMGLADQIEHSYLIDKDDKDAGYEAEQMVHDLREYPRSTQWIMGEPGHQRMGDNVIFEENASERVGDTLQKGRIQPAKNMRQRPQSCKRYDPALQKIKNKAFMISKKTTSSRRLSKTK
jgi:hypothetical protein